MVSNIVVDSDGKGFVVEYLYSVDKYSTFNIKIKSMGFSGMSNFCMPQEKIASYIESLSEMYSKLTGYCEIKDSDSDAYIKIEMHKRGHVSICGQVGGSHEEHSMRFKYTTDQTVLVNLIQIFKEYF